MTSLKLLKDHHHYKGTDLSRSEKIERAVVQMIVTSQIDDDQSESSKVWELKHSAGCCQIARILAQQRGLDLELAETAAVLHDIYTITTGSYQDHARLGAPIAEKLLRESGDFSAAEILIISKAIAHHSEKEIVTDDPYVELIKDVDVFDCSLYKNSEGYYRLHKPKAVFAAYTERVRKVRDELGLPAEPAYRE